MEKLSFERKNIEKKEKPKFVYHASQNQHIEEFTPQQGRVRDPKEGPVIFATPDKALASAFLVEDHNDDWMSIGYYSGILVVVIRSERAEFINKDKGGTMYMLPSDTFDFDPKRGMGECEWTSRTSVKPIGKESCPSALNAMIEQGAQVYFVDQDKFDEIINAIQDADDIGLSVLTSLQSENEHRGNTENPLRRLKDAFV